MIGIGRASSNVLNTCRRQLFFNKNVHLSFRKPLMASILMPSTMLSLPQAPPGNVASKRFFTQMGLLRSRWSGYFEGGSTNRYVRLNRFQQYQQGDRNPNSLGKVTLFGVTLMAGIYFLSPYLFAYVPPFTYFRQNPKQLVYALLSINVAVFGLWQIPRYWRFLQKYMLLEKTFIYSKWSLLGSAFSHQEFWHLGMNMLALWSFGTSLSYMIGASNFFSLYMNCAIGGSLFSLWYPYLAKLMLMGPSLGASGALFGVMGCFSYLLPNAEILLFVFPIPGGAWLAFLASVALNTAGCVFRWGSFDYAAHLGGSAIGVIYGWYISQEAKKQREVQRRKLARWF